jgi:hypothetical protein
MDRRGDVTHSLHTQAHAVNNKTGQLVLCNSGACRQTAVSQPSAVWHLLIAQHWRLIGVVSLHPPGRCWRMVIRMPVRLTVGPPRFVAQ